MRGPATILALVSLLSAVAQAAPTTDALVSGFMDPYLVRRVVEVDQLIADREADMDRTAELGRSLGMQKPWKAPAPQGPKDSLPNYIDLSSVPQPGVQLRDITYEAAGASYPRMPSVRTPPAILITACPSVRSVKAQGALGDGSTDDSDAITTACAKLPFLYFPPGTYRISTSITINKPIVAGFGVLLSVDASVTLTITARPHQWDRNGALFGGAGRVVLKGAVDQVHPDWFKNAGESDSDALQQAVDSCKGSCNIMLTRAYMLTRAWQLSQNVGVMSSNAGQLVGNGSPTGEGVVLRPGKYNLPLSFGTMWGFNSFAIKVRGGVTGADIQLSTIVSCGDGIVFAPDEGNLPTISNVFITHFTAANAVQNSVVFQAKNAKQLLRNCLVRGNFVVAGGFNAPEQQSAALAIKGSAAPALFGTSVIFQAVDPAQFSVQTQHVVLQNVAGTPARNVVFRLETWGGGIQGNGKVIAGNFNKLQFLGRMAGGVPNAQNFMASMTGTANWVTMSAIASAGAEHVMPTTPDRAAFNEGQVEVDQITYLNAPITGTWASGEERIFYFYNAYAKTSAARIKCLPFRAGNSGIVCAGFENQDAASEGQILIRLRNTAAYDIPSWQTSQRFGIQVGP